MSRIEQISFVNNQEIIKLHEQIVPDLIFSSLDNLNVLILGPKKRNSKIIEDLENSGVSVVCIERDLKNNTEDIKG
jgi:hypothetical protein